MEGLKFSIKLSRSIQSRLCSRDTVLEKGALLSRNTSILLCFSLGSRHESKDKYVFNLSYSLYFRLPDDFSLVQVHAVCEKKHFNLA